MSIRLQHKASTETPGPQFWAVLDRIPSLGGFGCLRNHFMLCETHSSSLSLPGMFSQRTNTIRIGSDLLQNKNQLFSSPSINLLRGADWNPVELSGGTRIPLHLQEPQAPAR